MNAEAHEAWRKWCEHAVENKWQDLSQGADALAACYLGAMARLAKAEKERGDLLGRARNMLCDGWTEIEMAAWLSDYRAFLERKTDDKQS